MKNLSLSCIFDDSTDNLNTTMEVVLDDERYKVSVCDGCEDDASPGAIKKLIPKRLEALEREKASLRAKMEMFKELADEMGFALVKKEDLEELNKAPAAPARAKGDPNALADKPIVEMNGAQFKMQRDTRNTNESRDGLSRDEAAAATEAARRQAQHAKGNESPTSGEAARFSKHPIPETVTVNTRQGPKTYNRPDAGVKKMQTVKGAAGLPTAIPKSIQGSDGETTITIVNTGGNKTIQMRGRQLAQMREQGDTTSYSQTCRPCQGTGSHAKRLCKACNGVGIII
jgi:hypothetical protein